MYEGGDGAARGAGRPHGIQGRCEHARTHTLSCTHSVELFDSRGEGWVEILCFVCAGVVRDCAYRLETRELQRRGRRCVSARRVVGEKRRQGLAVRETTRVFSPQCLLFCLSAAVWFACISVRQHFAFCTKVPSLARAAFSTLNLGTDK